MYESTVNVFRVHKFAYACVSLSFFKIVAVVVAFFICWAPFHAQRFMALYGRAYELEGHDLYRTIYQGVHYISGILYYISTCINPILYHIMSNKFRQAFKVRNDI